MKRILYVSFLLLAFGSFASAQTKSKALGVRLQPSAVTLNSAGRTPAQQKALVDSKLEMDKKGTSVTLKSSNAQPAREERTKNSNK